MKTRKKLLALHKETLTTLTNDRLTQVGGGWFYVIMGKGSADTLLQAGCVTTIKPKVSY